MFCVLFVSARLAFRGDSMPTKIVVKCACFMRRRSSSILGHVETDLRHELDRVPAGLLPGDERREQRLGLLLVADEVVVHHEDVPDAEGVDRLDLGQHLRHGFRPRPAPVHDDDVAELAVERAAARELDGHAAVPVGLEEIEARQGRVQHAGLVVLAVLGLPGPGRVVAHELRPRVLGLADHEHVHLAAQLLGAQRREGTAHHHQLPAAPEGLGELEHPPLVDHEARDPDDVGVRVEIDRLDVLVAEHDLVGRRRQPRDRRQCEVGEHAPLPKARQNAVEGPERFGVLRGDQVDLHAILPLDFSDPTEGQDQPARNSRIYTGGIIRQ